MQTFRLIRNLALVLSLAFITAACTRVEPGYVGIEVNLHGEDRGVSDKNIVTGRVYYNPWTTDIYIYPTFVQQFTWTADRAEGSPKDDSFTFSSSEGARINADIFISYSFLPEAVPAIFQEYRQEADDFTQGYMRGKVRDAFNRAGSQMKTLDIYGSGKTKLLLTVAADLRATFEPKGIILDTVSFAGALRLSSKVMGSIDSVIEAQNAATRAEAVVVQRTHEAEQLVEAAKGKLGAAKLEAEANRVLAASITPELTKYMEIQRWDGSRALVRGGATPIVSLNPDHPLSSLPR